MRKNFVEQSRPRMTIWRMRIACRITKATNTHTQYVILIAFPLQQRLHQRASMLRYTCIAFLLKISVCCNNYTVIHAVRYSTYFLLFFFWRVNVLYFVGIGSQPQKTWRHRNSPHRKSSHATMMAETGNHYRYGNGNMAEQTTTSFYLFSFSHYILNDVDTSNCKAMISMIKATCLFFLVCPANQPTKTGLVLCHKKAGRQWSDFTIWFGSKNERMSLEFFVAQSSEHTKFIFELSLVMQLGTHVYFSYLLEGVLYFDSAVWLPWIRCSVCLLNVSQPLT